MRWPWQKPKREETFAWCGCPDSWEGMGRVMSHDVKDVYENGEIVGRRYICHANRLTKYVHYKKLPDEREATHG